MSQPSLHQIAHGIGEHDAVGDHTFLLRKWLRAFGFQSEIYAPNIELAVAHEIHPMSRFRPRPGECVIYHHSIGSHLVEDLERWGMRVITVYHNITPAEFFTAVAPELAEMATTGREQLARLREISPLAFPVSAYNQIELDKTGFPRTRVLPLTFDGRTYDVPANRPAPAGSGEGPLLLFVGRISPHKRQEDLIKLLYCYRRIEPEARLALVGNRWMAPYVSWLEDLAAQYGLADAVDMPGLVSQADLVAYYRRANLYVSMSEHEGVGKPFLESMYLDLPILAYAASATPYTLGGSGVLFHQKDYPRLAELTDILIKDQPLRARLVARQRARIATFSEAAVQAIFAEGLRELGLLPL